MPMWFGASRRSVKRKNESVAVSWRMALLSSVAVVDRSVGDAEHLVESVLEALVQEVGGGHGVRVEVDADVAGVDVRDERDHRGDPRDGPERVRADDLRAGEVHRDGIARDV